MKKSAKRRIKRSLNTKFRKHFGGSTKKVEWVRREFPEYQIANLSVMCMSFWRHLDPEAEIVGTRGNGSVLDKPRMRKNRFRGFDPRPPSYEQVVLSTGETHTGLGHGVAFFRFEGEPAVGWTWTSDSYHPEYIVQVYTEGRERAGRILEALKDYECANSLFRGKLLRPKIDYSDKVSEAEILEHPRLDWDDAVLPVRLKEQIEREVLGSIRAAPILAANGVEQKRGILFHGPPGTGKTYVCNLLLSLLEGFTAILCSGESLERPGAVFGLAKRYAPSVILFEDVDLIATGRDDNPCRRALGQLLNELDGVGLRDQVYAIFTTNHLDFLEEAFARRPGRVDAILEFPLPDAPLRERLIRLYARKAHLELDDIDAVVAQTDGATPAFLRELMRSAIYASIEAGDLDEEQRAYIRDGHVRTALERLAGAGNAQNERIFGFRPSSGRAAQLRVG